MNNKMNKPQLCDCHLMYYPKYHGVITHKTLFGREIPLWTKTTLLDACPHCKGFDESEFHLLYNNLCMSCWKYNDSPIEVNGETLEESGCSEEEIINDPRFSEEDKSEPIYVCWAYEK